MFDKQACIRLINDLKELEEMSEEEKRHYDGVYAKRKKSDSF